jgi:2-methylcitrate dehydratase PrpD
LGTQSISEQFGAFSAGIEDLIPADRRHRATYHLLDALGVGLAASTFDYAAPAAAALAQGQEGDIPVIGLAQRLCTRDAALVNGMLIHGIDYDDTSVAARIHPSSACASAPLVLGAQLHSRGRDMLTAYITALECAVRIGAVAKGGFQRRGFHPTGIICAFGAVFGAARMLGLNAEQTARAQGIVYSAASGNMAYTADMAWTKRFNPGWGAVSGITAATLARSGFTAPRLVYEGKLGLFSLYIGDPPESFDLAPAVAGFGERWWIDGIAIKPLAACYFNVPLIDAALRIAHQHKPVIADIADVCVLVPQAALISVCEPAEQKRRPPDSFSAQFSSYFVVATSLVHGTYSLASVGDAARADPTVLALAQKVRYEIDPNTTFPKHYAGAVVVRMRDGTVFEAREDVDRGSSARPLSQAEVIAKFEENAGMVFDRPRVVRLRDMILDVERLDDVRKLAELLAK